MCAVDKSTKGDACKGDSGGPLMYKNKQNRYFVVGIVSGAWGKCGTPNVPGLYTMVKNYRSFITDNTPDVCLKSYDE